MKLLQLKAGVIIPPPRAGCSQPLNQESQRLPPAYLLPSSHSSHAAATGNSRVEPRSHSSPVLEQWAKARSQGHSQPAQLRERCGCSRVEERRVKEAASALERKGETEGRLQPAVPATLPEPVLTPRPWQTESPCHKFRLGSSWIHHQCATGILTVWANLAQLQEKRGVGSSFLND